MENYLQESTSSVPVSPSSLGVELFCSPSSSEVNFPYQFWHASESVIWAFILCFFRSAFRFQRLFLQWLHSCFTGDSQPAS